MSLELRHYRLFACVADRGSFTAAAKELGLSQPSVSRTVAGIERRLGVPLVTRTTRQFALTAAGEVFAREAAQVLEAAQAARERTIRAARGRPVVLGVKADSAAEFTTDLLATCAANQPTVRVELRFAGPADLPAAVRRGDCDAALVAWPISDTRLVGEALWTEPRVAVLPAEHPISTAESVHVSDFLGEPVARWSGVPEPVDRYFQGLDALPAAPVGIGPVVSDLAEVLRLVELGQAITFLPVSVAERFARPGLTGRDVDGLSPATVRLVRTPQDPTEPMTTFLRLCRHLAEQRERAHRSPVLA